MSSVLEAAFEQMQSRVGEQTSQSEWFEVTQDRINGYADVSMDHQWIHVDVDRAIKESPYGAPHCTWQSHPGDYGTSTNGICCGRSKNCGTEAWNQLWIRPNKISFTGTRWHKDPCDQYVRRVEIKGGMLETMNEIVVEAQGTDKPVCVAESLGRMVF